MGTIYRNGVPFVGSGGAGGVEMTQAEYELLPESEKMNGAIYFITDGDVSYPSASQMRYDNTESQIPATTVQGAIDENRIEINDLKSGLTRHFLEFNETNITTTSGTIQSSSIVRITYNNHNISIDYYIRVASSTGRPTITINGFPTLPTNITSTGFPTHARVGTTNYITDSNFLRYTAGTTYATLTFYNYLGEFPAGNGYFVASGNISWNY